MYDFLFNLIGSTKKLLSLCKTNKVMQKACWIRSVEKKALQKKCWKKALQHNKNICKRSAESLGNLREMCSRIVGDPRQRWKKEFETKTGGNLVQVEILSLEDIAKNGMLKSEHLTDAETDKKRVKHMFRPKSQKWKKGLESEIRLEITVRSVDVWRKTKTKTKRDFVGGGRKIGRGDGILRGTKSRRDLAVISLRPPSLMSHHNLFLLLCLQLVRITFLITRSSRW